VGETCQAWARGGVNECETNKPMDASPTTDDGGCPETPRQRGSGQPFTLARHASTSALSPAVSPRARSSSRDRVLFLTQRRMACRRLAASFRRGRRSSTCFFCSARTSRCSAACGLSGKVTTWTTARISQEPGCDAFRVQEAGAARATELTVWGAEGRAIGSLGPAEG